jgi:SAM-dependent methyltransferase
MADKPIALETRAQAKERLFSPSAARNREPILQVLREILPPSGRALEIASGTGEHIACFASRLPGWHWIPSDPDHDSRLSIAAWIAAEDLSNVAPPLAIDASAAIWCVEDQAPFDTLLSLNMIHIAPWSAAQGLFAGAGRLLRSGGTLLLYGPFQEGGIHNAPSNTEFDLFLKSRNPDWGVRDIDDLQNLARANGISLVRRFAMPANNLSLVFEKHS